MNNFKILALLGLTNKYMYSIKQDSHVTNYYRLIQSISSKIPA